MTRATRTEVPARRGRQRAVAAAVVALLLSACGVPHDDAPRALSPAEVPFASETPSPVATPAGEGRVELHFVRGDDVVVTTRRVETSTPTPELLELLLAGPAPDEREAGLISVIPSTVTVEDVSTVGTTAVVTLGGPDSEVLRLQPLAYAQIVATLAPERASGVRFRLDGADLRVPRGDGSLTDAPLTREDYEQLLAPADDAPAGDTTAAEAPAADAPVPATAAPTAGATPTPGA